MKYPIHDDFGVVIEGEPGDTVGEPSESFCRPQWVRCHQSISTTRDKSTTMKSRFIEGRPGDSVGESSEGFCRCRSRRGLSSSSLWENC